VLFSEYYLFKADEMDGTCSIHGENKKFLQNLSLRSSREDTDCLENLGIKRRRILK
jgi:hypothetical protein